MSQVQILPGEPKKSEDLKGRRISFILQVRNEPTPLRKNSRSTTIVVLFGLLTAKYDGEAEKRQRCCVFSILARTLFEARVAGSKK